MKILIAGSHGIVGSAVTAYLVACGHQVSRLVRSAPGLSEVWWDPDKGEIDTLNLEGFDGVVHLASMPWPCAGQPMQKKKYGEIIWVRTACWLSR